MMFNIIFWNLKFDIHLENQAKRIKIIWGGNVLKRSIFSPAFLFTFTGMQFLGRQNFIWAFSFQQTNFLVI